jgi:glycerol 3-phosphatase-2
VGPSDRVDLSDGGERMSRVGVAARYDAILFDLDGVVYRADEAVPGAAETLHRLRAEAGIPLLFLTNNSSRTPDQVAAKLDGLGVRAAPEEVLTSSLATAAMLEREGARGQTAFVIGERGIREALQRIGVELVDGEPDRTDIVVVGWDRSADYSKLRRAGLLVQRGARLVATNADASYPAPDGLWPGAGALLAAVVTTTGASPAIVGKPSRPLFEAAAAATGAGHPLVVGDRLDTDIAGAAGMGWDSWLVLSGASRPADLLTAISLPTFISPDVTGLLDGPPAARFGKAEPGDAQAISALLVAAGLTPAGVEDRLDTTVVCSTDGAGSRGAAALLATAAVELSKRPGLAHRGEGSEREGLLRSVAVREGARGHGLGMLTVAHAARLVRDLGLRRLFLFTGTAAPFFERLGFHEVEPSQLPDAVREGPQARNGCSAAAVAYAREL